LYRLEHYVIKDALSANTSDHDNRINMYLDKLATQI